MNYLEMADQGQILALLGLGWSYRRIARETGKRLLAIVILLSQDAIRRTVLTTDLNEANGGKLWVERSS